MGTECPKGAHIGPIYIKILNVPQIVQNEENKTDLIIDSFGIMLIWTSQRVVNKTFIITMFNMGPRMDFYG